jgi:anti-anti-sigma regulatory factor
MTTNGTWLKVDEKCAMQDLPAAVDSPDRTGSELVIDCSDVRRLDARAVEALAELANKADGRQAKVVLHGVNVEVYKVLRLLKLTARLSFTN